MPILRGLIFLPSLTFMLVPAEIFPWAFFYSIAQGVRSMPVIVWICLVVSLALACASLVTGVAVNSVLDSYGSVLNVVLIFVILCHVRYEELMRVSASAKWIMLLLVWVGLLQLLGLWSNIDNVMQHAVPRGGIDKMGAGGRGVSLLDTEPSRAGFNFLFLYSIYRAVEFKRYAPKGMLIDLLVFAFIVVVTRSTMAVGIAALYFAIEYLTIRRFWLYPTLLIVLVAALGTFFDAQEIRALGVISKLAEQDTIADAVAYIFSASGFRFVTVLGAYEWACQHWFGGGFGTWPDVSVTSLELTGISATELGFFRNWANGEYVPLKPTAFMALVALEHGLIGLVLVAGWLLIKLKKMNAFNSRCRGATLTAIFTIFFAGSVGNPLPWIVLAIVPRLSAYQIKPSTQASFDRGTEAIAAVDKY